MRNIDKTSSNVLIHNVLGKYPVITVCIGVQTYISIDHYSTKATWLNQLMTPIMALMNPT